MQCPKQMSMWSIVSVSLKVLGLMNGVLLSQWVSFAIDSVSEFCGSAVTECESIELFVILMDRIDHDRDLIFAHSETEGTE